LNFFGGGGGGLGKFKQKRGGGRNFRCVFVLFVFFAFFVRRRVGGLLTGLAFFLAFFLSF